MTEENLPEGARRRWHDARGSLSETVDLLEFIPPEARPHIAEALTSKANKDFGAAEILSSLKSLGSEKILMLHQMRKKRRSYDQDPNLHKIVSTFFVLPDEAQDNLAADFLAFIELIVEYMANCDSFELEPKEAELVAMRNLFVESGAEAVKSYLSELHQPYYQRLDNNNALTDATQSIVQREQGLRLRDAQAEEKPRE